MKTYYKFKTIENFYYDLLERNIFLLYPTQLVIPSVVAIAVKKLMAIWRMVFQVSAFILVILIQFLKVKLIFLCVSHEVNFPLVY